MKIKSLIQLTSAAALLPFAASAATITWTGGTADYETGTNWDIGVPTNDTSTDVATFIGDTTVDLASDRAVSGLNFSSGTSTLTGSGNLEIGNDGITVGGNTTISTAGLILNQATAITLNGDLGISSVITGTGDLTVTAGTSTNFTMTGNNGDDNGTAYGGNVVFDGINASVSRYFLGGSNFNGGGAGTAGTLSLLNGTTISTEGGGHQTFGDRDIIISGGATIVQNGNNNVYGLTGVISGTGGLTLQGTGDKVQLQGGANTFTGGLTIDGTIVDNLAGSGSLGDASNTITFDNGGTLKMGDNNYLGNRDLVMTGDGTLDVDTNINYSGSLSGAGHLTIETNTEQRWGGSTGNTNSGGVTLDGINGNGGVRMGAGDTLGTGDITLKNGAYLKNQNNSFTITNNIIVDSTGGGITSGWSNRRITLTGLISGDGELSINNDSSEVYINNGSNSYTGGTRILGNLAAENAGSLGTGAITFDGGFIRNDNSNIDLGTRDIIIEDGGAEIQIGWTNRRIQMNGVVSGTGAITVMDDSSNLILSNTNTYSGGTEIRGFVQASTGSLGTGDVTLNAVTGGRGQLKNNGGATTLANNVIIGANGGQMQAGWTSNLEITGVVSGAGDLIVAGDSGTVVLSNSGNTFTGDINLQDSNSALSVASLGGGAYDGVISGDAAATFTWTGDGTFTGTNTLAGGTSVASGGSIGGSGSFAGDLTLETGSTFIFSATDTLTVSGAVSLFSGFGVDDIEGLGSGTAVGTYTLIDGTASDFSGVDNFGEENWASIGGGKFAYLENGSLNLVVAVPEPGTFALLAGMLALGSVMIRRRRA